MELKDDRFYNECRGYSEMVFLFIGRSIKNRIRLIMKKETKYNLLDWCLHGTFILLYVSIFFLIYGVKKRNIIISILSGTGIIVCVLIVVLILYFNPYKKHKTKKRDRQKKKNIQMIENNKKDEQSNKE